MPCKLCLEEKQLRKSHIIPEFIYKHGGLYDDKHRFEVMSVDPNQKQITRQKGLYEYLLCQECETFLNEQYEKYGKHILFDQRHMHFIDTYDEGIGSFHDLSYDQFKLFLLSILWRAGVSQLPDFKKVVLGKHEEWLRQMLITGNPGKQHEYGCLVIAPHSELKAETFAIRPPQALRCSRHHGYLFLFGGLFWWYLVSSHSTAFPRKDLFLSSDGILPVITRRAAGQVLDRLALNMALASAERQRRQQSTEL